MHSHPLPFNHMTNEADHLRMVPEHLNGIHVGSGRGGGLVNPGQTGQPYYGQQVTNQMQTNFLKASSQAPYTNQANVLHLRSIGNPDSSLSHHKQGMQI